ncbi:DndE family protein [Methylobacillus sp. Pita1]|uniref:DndE family protein n=1 Tax=Methylobacillus sp. Pita1 TaxID=3382642 RepID=UPI0038B495B7
MSNISLESVLLANFQTSGQADKFTEQLRSSLGLSARYRVARLALGRSLSDPSYPNENIDSQGKTIKGELLFGIEELPLWVGLLLSHAKKANPKEEFTLAALQNIVKRHWHRGMMLLINDWQEADEDYMKFMEILVKRRANLPDTASSTLDNFNEPTTWDAENLNPKPIHIELGPELDSGETFRWTVNGSGYSPHIAIMGQAGSGKTRTMLESLKQIHHQAGAPVILLDLGKGDLADKPELINALNARVLRVPEQPIPLDMFFGSDESETRASDQVMGFRDSFAKAMQSKAGAKQLDAIREALKPLFSRQKEITLFDVKDALKDYYEENDIRTDSVISTINDLTERSIFEPEYSPQQFFSQSWIITFAHAHETTKNLAVYLLLDALNTYMKRLPEAPVDAQNHRALRMVLAIDEARHILASRHLALSDNIRLHRSKGLVVTLASQSPDDYDGAGDDYLENIGLPICFKTNASSTQVLQNMFRGKVSFSTLPAGVCMTLKENKAVKIKSF